MCSVGKAPAQVRFTAHQGDGQEDKRGDEGIAAHATEPANTPTDQCKWAWSHGARSVRTVLGKHTPQTDPHRKALDSNIGTRSFALLRL